MKSKFRLVRDPLSVPLVLTSKRRNEGRISEQEPIGKATQTRRICLVIRKVIPGKPAHTEYSPTEKGMAVREILAEIASFSTNV